MLHYFNDFLYNLSKVQIEYAYFIDSQLSLSALPHSTSMHNT